MENRLANGIPLKGEQVVAADAIAKLAGVTGKDVSKVLLAIHAISVGTGQPVAEVVNIEKAPTAPADHERYAVTEDFVGLLIHNLQKKSATRHLLSDLRVHKRPIGDLPPTLRATHCALKVVGNK